MLACDFQTYKKELPFVTSKEIYLNGDTNKFHPEGLYSEVVFGSKVPNRCQCGALSDKQYQGEICDICNVVVDDGSRRKEQFAKIKLRKKILLPPFEKAIKSLFGLKSVKDIFAQNKYKQNLVDPYYFDMDTNTLRKKKSIKGSSFKDSIFANMPIYDIASINKLFDFLISDPTFRLIVESKINSDHFEFVFTDEILVYPPSTRPIVVTGQKKDIPDSSKFYRKLLSMTNGSFWDKKGDGDEEWNKTIYSYQRIMNEFYEFLIKGTFTEKTSVLRDSFNGSTVEYSARCIIVPEPAIPPFCIGLALETMLKIYSPDLLNYLYVNLNKFKEHYDSNKRLDEKFDIFDMIHLIKAGKINFDLPEGIVDEFLFDKKEEFRPMIERAPVLWRFNFSNVMVVVVLKESDGYLEFDASGYFGPRLANTTMYNNKVMQVNTTIAPAFNFDFDGDGMTIYALHSKQAKKDSYNAFLGNGDNIKFEHNNSLVPTPEHESIYAMWALTERVKTINYNQDEIDSLECISLLDFKVDFRLLTTAPEAPVKLFHDDSYIVIPYAIASINKSFGMMVLPFNPGAMPKKKMKRLISSLLDTVGKDSFYGHFHEANKFLLICSTVVGYCNPTFSLKDFAVGSIEISDYKDTLINEPFLGFHQNDILFTEYVKKEIARDPKNSLYRVSESDARIKSVQLLKAASNNGIPTDIHGKAFIKNIKEDLLTGHTKEGFFQSGDSARLALAQRQEAIPRGGELQRRFYWITGFLKLAKHDDCGSKRTFPIFIRDENHLHTLDGRWFIKDKDAKIIHHNFIKKNNLILLDTKTEDAKSLIGTTVEFRSPIYCEQPGYKICDKCMGIHQTKSVNLGAGIGAYIPESIIQSVLRTHHFSGAFITVIMKPLIELIKRNRFSSPNIMFLKNDTHDVDLKILKDFYNEHYTDDDLEIKRLDEKNTPDEIAYEIIVHNPPFNDDSVKQLNKIIQVLDKDRNEDNFMPLDEMYNNLLEQIVLPNGILSIYIELIMSLMFFDENDVIIRYGGSEHHQSALKKIINKCDPRLSLFYNLNESAIAMILKDSHKLLGAEHMLSGLLNLYKK